MSSNKSRSKRSESSQHRKPGRSNKHRNFSGDGCKGSGSGTGATVAASPPSPSSNNDHLTQLALRNGAHPQQQSSHGLSDAPVSSSNVKPADMATQKATPAPRATSSTVSGSVSKHPLPPATTTKAEASWSFPLQFGSINPVLVNGIQALHDSFKAHSNIPPPSSPKQQLPRKDAGMVGQTNNISEGHAAGSSSKGSVSGVGAAVPASASAPSPSPSSNNNPALTSNRRCDDEIAGPNCTSSVSVSAFNQEKSVPESNVASSPKSRCKKKKWELSQKLDNVAATADLYKRPEENKEMVVLVESVSENNSTNTIEQVSSHKSFQDLSEDRARKIKVEPERWEDAADISTPKLKTSEDGTQVIDSSEDVNGTMPKKYSRDFLLKFAEKCPDIPMGIVSDVPEAFLVSNAHVSCESHHTSERIIEKQNLFSRVEHCGNGLLGKDKCTNIVYGTSVVRFQPGQVRNYGVHRNLGMHAPMQYPSGNIGGPSPSPGSQFVMPRNRPDSDRWQHGTAFQEGLMSFCQTPLQMMHKAEKRYQIIKVTDEEQAKQRQLKAILNKLTPQNFEKLFEQVKQVNIDNAVTLTGVISQIFDKALMEPTFCEMYANFCHHLAVELPDLSVDNEKITFRALLLNKCQHEFERGEREEEEADKAEEEGEVKQTAEEKRLKARRRMLGNIRLIGELYKKKMLTERIMHECIKKLLGEYQNPDEENVEALCKLMTTIGETIDHPKTKIHMDAYFDMMANLSNDMKLSSRVRFMLKDVIDMRTNKWQQRRKIEGPKKIDDVHRDAAQERQAQAIRLAPTSMGTSVRMAQPMDFSLRGARTARGNRALNCG